MSKQDAVPPTPKSGWYSYGVAGYIAYWNGEAWTGHTHASSAGFALPKWKLNPFRFLGHSWFWLLILFWAITTAIGFIANGTEHVNLLFFFAIAIPTTAACFAFTTILWPHLQLKQLNNLGKLTLIGIASGFLGFTIATFLEGYLEPDLGFPFAADLWLSGPIEETCKLLLPAILWFTAKGVYRDPRVGLYLVLVSGSVFGGLEAPDYVLGAGQDSVPAMAYGRVIAELSHPIWTAIAASMIWLAAQRAGRFFTLAGFGGWLIPVALHSLHDGAGAVGSQGTKNPGTSIQFPSLEQGFAEMTVLVVISIVILILSYLVLRHFAARELVPPSAIETNAPHWRPRIAKWGMPKDQRASAGSA